MTSSLLPAMTERALQEAVIEAAQTFKWLVYHTYDSRRSAAGFPDLVLARQGKVLFVELKSEKGRTSGHQRVWAHHLPEVLTWRPHDWTSGHILEVLR